LNTLLDGEIVRQKWRDGREQLTFLIFDILALDGLDTRALDYGQRIGKIERKIVKPWEAFARDWPEEAKVQPFQLALKKPQAPYGTEMMFRETIPKLPHGNDGLIFTCKDTKYVCGTDQNILKWKPPMENTVDFRLRLGAFPVEVDGESGERFEDFDAKPEIELLVFHGNVRGLVWAAVVPYQAYIRYQPRLKTVLITLCRKQYSRRSAAHCGNISSYNGSSNPGYR
jgi:mRNA guanylyltransferase